MYGTPGLTVIEKAYRVGRVRAIMQAGAEGTLAGSELLEPVSTQPELWELKWKYRGNVEYRMYHAEPAGGSPDLVALRFHLKDVSAPEEIVERQEMEMRTAADRHDHGEPVRWGHPRSGCTNCLPS